MSFKALYQREGHNTFLRCNTLDAPDFDLERKKRDALPRQFSITSIDKKDCNIIVAEHKINLNLEWNFVMSSDIQPL